MTTVGTGESNLRTGHLNIICGVEKMDFRKHSLIVTFLAAAVMTSVLSGCKEDKKTENEAKETPATQQDQQGMSGMDGQQGMSGDQPATGENTGN